MAITYNRFDLDFLFEQVSINYRFTDGNGIQFNFVDGSGNDIAFNYSELTNALDPRGVREVSGANNNLVGSNVGNYDPTTDLFTPGPYTEFGGADSEFLRTFEATYSGQAGAYGTSVDYDVNGVGGGTGGNPIGTGVVGGNVVDGSPRLIANLITSSVIDPSNPLYNPAADQARLDEGGFPVDITLGNGTVITAGGAEIPNAGVLEGIQYNEWFVAFRPVF